MICFEWIDAAEAPEDWYAPVLYVTHNGKLGVLKDTVSWYGGNSKDKSRHFSDWDSLRDKYSIKQWIYQSELI